MSVTREQQKIIYDFLSAVVESFEGFRHTDGSGFVYNEALAKTQAPFQQGTATQQAHDSSSYHERVSFSSMSSFVQPVPTGTYRHPISDPVDKPVEEKLSSPVTVGAVGTTFTPDELWAFSQIQYDVSQCRQCRLCEKRHTTVFGEGAFTFSAESEPKYRPAVMVIGEGPGHDEDVTGRPFVGRAGQLLDKMLGAIGLSRQTNCYICNIVKCRPPDNRTPEPDEVAACVPYLHRQIQLIRPRYLLLLGRTATHALLDTGYGMHSLHGKWFTVSGIPALCTYHPSALLHNEALKRPAWEDLKIFRERLSNDVD